MQMMPYWYTTFANYHCNGTPPFYAMDLILSDQESKKMSSSDVKEKSLDNNPYLEAVQKEIKDQYMAGESLLVAPMFKGQESRTVILPQGNWYDFYTGEYAGNGEVITVKPGLDKIPVFVRDGAIIPMMEARLHAPKAGEKVNLIIRHYGQKDGTFLLYDDDGETFNYENGAYSWREIKVTRQKNGKMKGSIAKPEKGKPDTVGNVTWKFMTQAQ